MVQGVPAVDQRELIRRFETSDPKELAEIIRSATELLYNRIGSGDLDPRAPAQRDIAGTRAAANGVDPSMTESERQPEGDRARDLFTPTTRRASETIEAEVHDATE